MYNQLVIPPSFGDVTALRVGRGLDTASNLQARLLNSCIHNSVVILRSNQGHAIGYAAWAKVSRETLNVVSKTKSMPAYPYELWDGKIFLIYDVVFDREWAFYAKNELYQFLRKKRFFAYYRSKKLVFCGKNKWWISRISQAKLKLIKL